MDLLLWPSLWGCNVKEFDDYPLMDQYRFNQAVLDVYRAIKLLTVDDFNQFAKTPLGGAMMFTANQLANQNDMPVFYIGMYDQSSDACL